MAHDLFVKKQNTLKGDMYPSLTQPSGLGGYPPSNQDQGSQYKPESDMFLYDQHIPANQVSNAFENIYEQPVEKRPFLK